MRRRPRTEPLQYVTGPTFRLIWGTVRDLFAGSWLEKFLAPLVGLLLVCVAWVFLPYLLLFDLAVVLERAFSPGDASASPQAGIRVGPREPLAFPAAGGVGLRCAYCHDETSGLTHTCGECGTLIHTSCAAELGGCPTLGCSKAREPRKRLGA